MLQFLNSPLGHSIITGFVAAAMVDFHALLAGEDWSVFKTYNWNKATFRWFIGIATGLVTGLGFSLT